MMFEDYQRDAARTINAQGHPHDLINHTLGLAGETGEVVELVKKYLYHGHILYQVLRTTYRATVPGTHCAVAAHTFRSKECAAPPADAT